MSKIIAEIGINHRGSAKIATELVGIASEAGAWGVKFQYRSKSNFYSAVNEIGDEIISQELERTYLSPESILEICEYGKTLGLQVGISFFKFADASDFGDHIHQFDFFKVPSAELLNFELVKQLATLKKTVIISTGGHSEDSIFRAVDELKSIEGLVYLHCISNYPVLLGNQELGFMKRLADRVGEPVGYSSHDHDWEVCLFAIALGANFIERHLTYDKSGPGLDDSSSSDPEEFKMLCRFANAYQGLLGSGYREVNQGELINMQNLGSSLYATRDILPGEDVGLDNCEIRAPRKGLTLFELENQASPTVKRHIKMGTPVTQLHFSEAWQPLSQGHVDFCDKYELSIPIRLHDADVLQNRFSLENFELHLSYNEVYSYRDSPSEFLSKIFLDRKYSIHLPDYLPSNRLIDPLSPGQKIKEDSTQIIDVCVDLADALQNKTGHAVPVVGSFSRVLPAGKSVTYHKLNDYLKSIENARQVSIYPQWLPRIAWYFGGAEILNMFCGSDDVAFVTELGMEICLDLSHLILAANYDKADWRNWSEQLLPLSRHLHIADAKGVDGEGIEFGKGELGDLSPFLKVPQRRVLEVWQGHLREGEGFDKAIHHLRSKYA